MKILIIVTLSFLSAAALVLLFLHIKSRKPLRSALLQAALGIGMLVLVNLTARFTGIRLPLNAYTLTSAAVFGIPAVCGFLILNLML